MKYKRKINKWLLLIILSLGGGLIYQLPLLRYTFYEPLRQAMRITDGQLGLLASVYGITTLICYLPSGYIADKYSPNKLISFSLIMTGAMGMWYSTFPSYQSNIIIFAVWGIVTILTYWSAFIKATGMLSEDGNTSKYYGAMDGIRGCTATIVSFLSLYVFRKLGESVLGVKWVIIIFSICLILIGIISFFTIPDKINQSNSDKSKDEGIKVKDILIIAKMKTSWLIAGIIFTTFGMLNASSYLVPYSETIFGASVSMAVVLGIIRTHIMQLIGGPSGGILATKLKSTSKVLIIGYIVAVLCSIGFLVIPIDKSLVLLILIITAIQGFMLCAMRGIYFSTISDAQYAERITGSVIGFASFIGFLTDGFFFGMAGSWIDKFGINGYRMIFGFMVLMCILGFIFTLFFMREVKKIKDRLNSNSV